MVLRGERHNLRLLVSRTEIHHTVGKGNDVKVGDKHVAHPHRLGEHVHYGRLPVHHRGYRQILHKHLERHLDYLPLRYLVHLPVEQVVVPPVPLDRAVHGKLPYTTAELGELVAELPASAIAPIAPEGLKPVLLAPRQLEQLAVEGLNHQCVVLHNPISYTKCIFRQNQCIFQ